MEEGHSVRVFCLRIPGQPEYETIWNSVEVYRISETSLISRLSAIRLLGFWIACLKTWRKRNGKTVIHCHDLSALPPGVIIALIHRLFLAYDSHELFPESAKSRLGSVPFLIFYVMEFISCMRVNLLVGVAKSQLSILKRRCRAPSLVVNNYPSLAEMEYRYHESTKKPVVFGMSGYVYRTRGHKEAMDALSLLSREVDLEFWVIGDGPEQDSLKQKASTVPYTCRFFGYVESTEQMYRLVSELDYAIITNHPSQNYLVTSMNRPYEYAALGVPFICPHFEGVKDILEAMNLPRFNPLSPISIKNAIKSLMRRPRAQLSILGRKLVEERFSWEDSSKKLLYAYRRLS
jgi:glycosyltransferase involved in cell wall biosynthesis